MSIYDIARMQEACPACGKARRLISMATPFGLMEWYKCDHCEDEHDRPIPTDNEGDDDG